MKKLLLLLFIVAACGLEGYSQTYNYDVNGDGKVTAVDVTALYDYLLGNVPIEPSVSHEYVDLGLPSGTLWATKNIGATSPEDYGDYFAWGETTPKEVYDWYTYMWGDGDTYGLTKYCAHSSYGYNGFVDNKTELDPMDDAAYVNWGPEWRMPSKEQIVELQNYCNAVWTTRNGVNGCLLTSSINGTSLFFPAAGNFYIGSLDDVGEYGQCRSRTLHPSNDRKAFSFGFGYALSDGGLTDCSRVTGRSVRAVRVSQK